jgi:hypothetical protein
MGVEIAILAGIQIDPTINGLMADPHAPVIWIVKSKPSSYCLWRPIEPELLIDVFDKWRGVLSVMAPGLVPTFSGNRLREVVPVNSVRRIC